MAKSLMDRNQDDGVKEQMLLKVKVQEKVVTTRSRRTCDAEVCVGTSGRTCTANDERNTEEQWTRPWIHGCSSGRKFHWKNQSSVHNKSYTKRETMSPEWETTQDERIQVLFESTRKFPHSTERRPKNNNGTRKKRKHTQSCLSVDIKRDTIDNLPDVQT